MKTSSKKMKTLRVFKIRESNNSYSFELVRLWDDSIQSYVYAVFYSKRGQSLLCIREPDYTLVRNYFTRVILANSPIL